VTAHARKAEIVLSEPRHLGGPGERAMRGAFATGAVAFVASLAIAAATEDGMRRFHFAYLLNFSYFLSIVLGGLSFVLIQHVTKAGWSVVVRRVAEGFAGAIPIFIPLALPLVFGLHELYHWSHADSVAHDPILRGKAAYLNTPAFTARMVVYFAAWTLMARFFVRASVAQDATGDKAETLGMQRWSGLAILIFGITITFAGIDLLMSLDPHWFSSIFGVYFFAGAMVGFLAAFILALHSLQSAGLMRHVVTIEHYHDIGKLLFGFLAFWAYIAYSQYMLIWYSNMPEETGWFLRRISGGWGVVSGALVLGHFLIPFVLLLSRNVKRRVHLLAPMAVWMLVAHWVDLYWLVMPEFDRTRLTFHALDLTVLVALGGIVTGGILFGLRKNSLIPERDPRLEESVNFENA
jgi:hypothetical protein